MMRRRPINVLHLISSLEVGGSETLLLELLSACRDDDRINFTVVVMNQNVNSGMREKLDRLSLPVYYLDRPQGQLHPKYLLELLRIIDRHHIEVVHTHNTGSKLWSVLCKVVFTRLKLVFTFHDTFRLPVMHWPEILLHRHCFEGNIAISKTVASLCQKRGISNHRHIYNGIRIRDFSNPQRVGMTSRMKNNSFEQKPMHILNIGRMDTDHKGQDVLVDAVAQCLSQGMNVKATLMGGVYAYNWQSFESLKAKVKNMRVENQVEFLLNQSDTSEQMAHADLFAFPSKKEGFGLVILEAMASGIPIIASNVEGPSELIQEGVTGLLFENQNASHLAEKIKSIYFQPELADDLRENALQYVQKFDISIMKRHYYRYYESLFESISAVSEEESLSEMTWA